MAEGLKDFTEKKEKMDDFLERYEFLNDRGSKYFPIAEDSENTLFCSFNYLTPNYYILRPFREIARFSKNGFQVYLIYWDISALSTTYFKKILPRNLNEISSKKFMEKKEEEVMNILGSFGANLENIEIIHSSELWKRFIQTEERDLFLSYFRVLSEMDVEEHKGYEVKDMVQMPLEMFFINYFEEIYPELPDESINFALAFGNRKELYEETRKLMSKEGYISSTKRILLGMERIPFYSHEGYIPTWEMDINRIVEIISNSGYEEGDFEKLVNCLKYYLPSIHYIKDNDRHECEAEEVSEIAEELDEMELIESVAWNIHRFCRDCREKYQQNSFNHKEGGRMLLSDREDISQVGKILRSDRMLEILQCVDGNKTVSEIADELGIQLSNASNYISKLENAGLVESTPDKKIRKKTDTISINVSHL